MVELGLKEGVIVGVMDDDAVVEREPVRVAVTVPVGLAPKLNDGVCEFVLEGVEVADELPDPEYLDDLLTDTKLDAENKSDEDGDCEENPEMEADVVTEKVQG